MPRLSLVLTLAFSAGWLPSAGAKEGYSLITPEEAQRWKESLRGRVNVPEALAKASDQELWDFVPPAGLKRAVFLGPNDVGCPVHGKEIFRVGGGFYPWKYSADRPWKVQCPVGGEYYPTNDFGAYFRAGMEAKLDTGERYVDDGNGWVDEKGRRFYFVAHWVFWQRWRDVLRAIRAFTDAYFATGDEQYAHRAAVVFCALAEQYPKMDYPKQHTGGGTGMILPWCWENQQVVTPLAQCYDRLFPYLRHDGDERLRAFLKTKTELGPRRQIEQKFIQTVAKVNFTTDMYWSNECDHQLALADLALAWDNNDPADGITTRQMVDWLIRHGGDNSLEELLYNCTYRDGFPCEGAIGYSSAIAQRQVLIADRLKKAGVNLFEQFPRLKHVARVWIDMTLEDGHCPSIGDSGSVLGSGRTWKADVFHRGWENYRDPKFAQALWQIKSMRRTPYSPDRTAEFKQAIEQHGERLDHRTRNLGGMGLAILESGGPLHPRGLALFYGCPAGGHCHHDRLNIEFFDHRQAMLPDLGYPDQWSRKRHDFTSNTIGHYGVLVDEQGETDYLAGYLGFIKGFRGVQVVSAHAERCFPGTSLYRRTTALIDLSPTACYVADVFRVRGGRQHDWSFHLPPVPKWGIEGVELSPPQQKGSLAGEDLAVGAAMPEGRPRSGFNWLGNVQRGRPAGAFTFVGQRRPPYPGLRMTMLPGCAQEIIVADHESPRIKATLPPTLKWLLARNVGQDLSSAVACVVEACPEAPLVQKLERLACTGGTEPIAMHVVTPGFRDTILSDEEGDAAVSVAGFGAFKARWAFVRQDALGCRRLAMVKGESVQVGPVAAKTRPSWDGTITGVAFGRNSFDVDVSLPAGDALAGEWTVIHNDRHRTCYEIARVEARPRGSRVFLTEITPMVGKGYVDKVDDAARTIHTDTRWRIYGKNQIWSGDFGPALTGYALLNEDRTAAFEIEACKLMPSRKRSWWKPEPAWIKVGGRGPIDAAFRDVDGDGRRGFWVYDFHVGSRFCIPNSVSLERRGTTQWSLSHLGAEARLTLPCTQPIDRVLVRAAGGDVRTLPAEYDGAAKTATFTLPAGLRSPTAIALRPAKGVDLSDVEPPLVKEIRVDGQPRPDADSIELFLAKAPKLVEVTLEDARSPVDLQSVRVEAGLGTVHAGEPGVDVQGGLRRATVRLAPPQLVDFRPRDVPTTYNFRLIADDLAIDDNQTVRDFRFIIGPAIAEGAVFLSDLEPAKAFAHAGVKRDTSYLGDPIWLAGVPYRKGLMVCPERTSGPVNYGEAIYRIPRGRLRVFRAVIGIEDSAGGGKVKFEVQLRGPGAEWKTVFESGNLVKGQTPQGVCVELGDADEIRLYTDAVGSIGCDHALFAGARFEP